MRADGLAAGALKITTFRPFPLLAVREALEGKKCVVVLEKSLEVGLGGIVASDVRMALRGLTTTPVYTVIAGLGGRPITKASLDRVFRQAIAEEIEDPHFLDLDWDLVDRELARSKERRRSGPIAENILRQRGLVGGRPHWGSWS